jgi:tetratricopeptide (TPR) repeat protein
VFPGYLPIMMLSGRPAAISGGDDMRNVLMGIVILAATFSVQASVTATQLPPSTPMQQAESTRETIRSGHDALRSNDQLAAFAAFDSAIRSNGFELISEDMRYRTLLIAGQIAHENKRYEEAHALLVSASKSSQADSPAWHYRLAAAYAMEDYADSALCVASIAGEWPDTLGQINEQAIVMIEGKLADDPSQTARQQEFLQSLFDAGWSSADGGPDFFWRDLARLLLANGEAEKAAIVAARIHSARVALSMRIDKRFDGITQRNLAAYDVDRLAAKEIATARAKAASMADELHPLTFLQGLLLDTLQYDQALALADAVIAKVKDKDGAAVYKDFDDEYIWILDQRARALARLGRWDDAVEQWSRAARRPENGIMNVSQILNLGLFYADLERPGEALNMVSDLGPMSPYGRMQLEMVGLKAALQQGDESALAMRLHYMREHRADAIATWQDALLFSGDLDAAADLLVERLESAQWRSDALADAQEYADATTTPLETKRLQRWRTVLATPKVSLALWKFGRIEHFRLDRSET